MAGLAVAAGAHQDSSAAAAAGWADRPAAIPALSAASNPGLARCTSADLQVRLYRRGLIKAGTYAYLYRARNRGGHACWVSGQPSVQLAGHPLARGANILDVTAGVLAPGAAASFAITQSPRLPCAAARARSGATRSVGRPATIRIGSRDSSSVRAGVILAGHCTAESVTPIGVPPTAPKPGPLSALTVRLYAPATARAGRTAQFTVTITNPSRAAVRLAPCPDYETGISSGPSAAYQLNCSAPVIPARQSRTFDMQYRIPAGTRAGRVKIGWFLLDPDRTGAGSTITITR